MYGRNGVRTYTTYRNKLEITACIAKRTTNSRPCDGTYKNLDG